MFSVISRYTTEYDVLLLFNCLLKYNKNIIVMKEKRMHRKII